MPTVQNKKKSKKMAVNVRGRQQKFLFCLLVIISLAALYYLHLHWNNNNGISSADPFLSHKLLSNTTKLININFVYVINNVCSSEVSFFAIILVTSYAGDETGRSAHRRAISGDELTRLGFRRIFLLARIPTSDKYAPTQSAIANENDRYHDIVQGDFIESYRNLTYKHIMGLKWASEHCQSARFIIKMDDDIVVDFYEMKQILERQNAVGMLLMGYVLKNMNPVREPANKWFVTKAEYGNTVYPTFLSGWFYITNPRTAAELTKEAESTSYFWIDDIYVTGILAELLSVRHVNIKKYFTLHPEILECCITDWKKYQYKCDYLVGPTSRDYSLIVRYSKLAHECNLGNCSDRPIEKRLNDTCIVQRKEHPFGSGDAVVETIRLF